MKKWLVNLLRSWLPLNSQPVKWCHQCPFGRVNTIALYGPVSVSCAQLQHVVHEWDNGTGEPLTPPAACPLRSGAITVQIAAL